MLHRQESYTFLPAPFGLALCGLAFCGWNLWSADSVPCVSSGCLLFRDFTLGGFPMWWAGIAGFAVLALLALTGRPPLGKLFAGIGVLLDCLLLIILLTSAPCLPCLITGLLLALCYLAFLLACQGRQRPNARRAFSLLLFVWTLLFVANIGCLMRDTLDPWPMLSAKTQTPVSAYVSPSCPACRQLMLELPPEQADRIVWYPVAENEQDVRVIAALIERLDQGERLAQALPKALENPVVGRLDLLQPSLLLLQMRLWRNQARVLAQGGTLPLVEFPGLPAFLLPKKAQAAPAAPRRQTPAANSTPDLPVELDLGGQCGPMSGQPCVE